MIEVGRVRPMNLRFVLWALAMVPLISGGGLFYGLEYGI